MKVERPTRPPLSVSTGAEAVFIEYKTFGIKVFAERDHAYRSIKRQKKAYPKGLAPEVLSGVREYRFSEKIIRMLSRGFGVWDCELKPVMYGYRMEVVNVSEPEWWDYEEAQKHLSKLRGKLERLFGAQAVDVDTYNVGVKYGAVILIDFGDETLYDW